MLNMSNNVTVTCIVNNNVTLYSCEVVCVTFGLKVMLCNSKLYAERYMLDNEVKAIQLHATLSSCKAP